MEEKKKAVRENGQARTGQKGGKAQETIKSGVNIC